MLCQADSAGACAFQLLIKRWKFYCSVDCYQPFLAVNFPSEVASKTHAYLINERFATGGGRISNEGPKFVVRNSSRSASAKRQHRRLKTITSRLFLTETKPVVCPCVLPAASVRLQTAWLRSSQRMGRCPLIPAQQPSCPGQASVHPEAVPSMPWLVPDWIPPSNPFQRLFLFFYRSGMRCDFPFPLWCAVSKAS